MVTTSATENNLGHRPVLVVDFGAQYAQLIARRVREANVYSRDRAAHRRPPSEIAGQATRPRSSSPADRPACTPRVLRRVDAGLFEAGVPVLGICYGFQAMARALGGEVARTGLREYGAHRMPPSATPRRPCSPAPADLQNVWMSHGDSVAAAPAGLHRPRQQRRRPGRRLRERRRAARRRAVAPRGPALASPASRCWRTSCYDDRRAARPTGPPATSSTTRSQRIRAQVGDGRVICGALRRRRLRRRRGAGPAGGRRPADLRLRRPRTAARGRGRAGRAGLRRRHRRDAGTWSTRANSSWTRWPASPTPRPSARSSAGSSSAPSRQADARSSPRRLPRARRCEFLVQGTLYPDVVESGGGEGAANIKSHHNVGGLPEDLQFELVEPLRTLFKDEVRAVGAQLGLPRGDRRPPAVPRPGAGHPDRRRGHRASGWSCCARPTPSPAPSSTAAGLDDEIWQCPVVLLADVRSVGRAGRRPHLRPPDRAAPGLQRGRDDRRLGPAARTTCWRGSPTASPTRCARRQPGRARRHQQAAGHHRVGVGSPR